MSLDKFVCEVNFITSHNNDIIFESDHNNSCLWFRTQYFCYLMLKQMLSWLNFEGLFRH